MVVDSSALAAVLFEEDDAELYAQALARAERLLMSSVNHLEIALVVEARKGDLGRRAILELMTELGIETIAFDSAQSEVALEAWRRYGKGRHEAGLNMGDCAAYALSQITNTPLLFKGNDFPKTDVVSAIDDGVTGGSFV